MAKFETHKSTCSYCGVGCGLEIQKDQYGSLKVKGDENYPVNKGMLCSKGLNLHYTVMDKTDRLTHPQMRWNKHLPLNRVSWDTALDRTAAVFKSLIKKYGPESVGFYVSGQLLTEEYYLVNKLIKGFIGSNNIDTNSRLCMSSAVVGYKLTLGEDSVPVGYEDIEKADTFLIAGANPAWCHPILFRRLEQHIEKNPDVKVIVVDPRKTQTCSLATIHLQLKPGTDIYLFKAMGKVLVEQGKVDREFIDNYTAGFDDYEQSLSDHSLLEAAKICGVPPEKIIEACNYIGDAKGFISMWTMGLNQSSVGVNKNLALLALSIITGKIGKPGNGPLSLTGQPNAMGGREVGGLSNMLAVHKDYTNPEHRKQVGDFWGTDKISDKPGLTATQMMDAMNEGKLKAIWVICTNPVVSWPNARKADEALKKCNFVVVQDISNNSDTVKYADLVLPAAGYMEKEGTMTNSERRVSYLPKVIDAPGEALPDTQILQRFAEKMGYGDSFNYKNSSEIYDEHAALTEGTNLDVSGLSYDILKKERSVQWPYPKKGKKNVVRLFEDNVFFTQDKKAHLFGVPSNHLSEPVTKELPYILTTGRIRDQWHTMTRTGKVKKLNQHIDSPFAEIHPNDAKELKIHENDIVEISNGRGEVRVPVKITSDIREGVVFLPMHWGKKLNQDFNRANNLTSTIVDEKSKQPDFKYAAVQVKKYQRPAQRIAIVGAGAAAFKFITKYRESNQEDIIDVYSLEKVPFYNRVLLPDYISGEKAWDNLLKYNKEAGDKLQCNIFTDVDIQTIDRNTKTLADQKGNKYQYDQLILATGSSSFIPPMVEKSKLNGLFTMRSRRDADNLGKFSQDKNNIVIVGGGILGIELADSLRKIGKTVTVIQRSSRLMERQLDELGSQLLDLELKDREINIIYQDEVTSLNGITDLQSLSLRSGRMIKCDAVVFAIGTRPNIDIARNSGLNCGRGVVVNDYFQTSDKDIYAIGEIAEHNKQLFGITAAAEEQADLLVRYFLGDTSTLYQGSLLMNILKVEGLNLSSAGLVEIPNDSDDYEEIVFTDLRQRVYKKCIIYKDQMVGCTLIGSKDEFVEFRDLIRNKIELGDKRYDLLRSAGGGNNILGDLVCSCNGVGEGNLEEAIAKGCHSLDDLCGTTGAGTGCGSCKPEIKALLEKKLDEELTKA